MIEVTVKKNSKYRVLYDTPSNVRYILVYGPRGSGKSYRVSQAAMLWMDQPEYCRGFLMRNVLDTVRTSIFQDCQDRTSEMELPYKILDSGPSMKIERGQNSFSGRGFKKSSGNDTAKNKSLAGYNRVIIEEAEEIDKHDFYALDLSLRTTKGQVLIVLIFNPPEKGHWILDEWFNLLPDPENDGYFIMEPKQGRDDTAYIFSNYHDNVKNLDPNTVKRMESFEKSDYDYWLHKIVGRVPSLKSGLIFKNWRVCTREEYDNLEGNTHYGLDWGYTLDPTAPVEVKKQNNILGIKSLLYRTGLTNPMIAELLHDYKDKEFVADSSEPKSIDELNDAGMWVVSANKGPDSVRHGIQFLQQFELWICEDSPEVIEEFSNYSWKTNRLKEPTGEPEDKWNHGIDAVRYATEKLQQSYDFNKSLIY